MLRHMVLWVFGIAVFLACVALGFTLFGVMVWNWSERMTILLAVIEGLTLFFAVFAGSVAALAYAAAQAKPELDLVLTKDHLREITLEADESGRLDQRLHIYILNRGDAGCGYFAVELHFPKELIVQQGNFSSGFLRAEDWLPWHDHNQLRWTAINKGAVIPEKLPRQEAPGELLCSIRVHSNLSPGVDKPHTIWWRITAEKMGTREGQLTVRLKSKQPQTEQEG